MKPIFTYVANGLSTVCICTVPATLNGDVITRAQFEALQHAMKQLEVSTF